MSKFDKVFNRIIKEDRLDDIANKMRRENDDFFKSTRDKFEKQNRDFYNSTREKFSDKKEEKKTYACCSRCRQERPAEDNFCEECGRKLLKYEDRTTKGVVLAPCGMPSNPMCHNCHIVYDFKHSKCDKCGKPLLCVK